MLRLSVIVVSLVLVACAWIVIRAIQATGHLSDARQAITALRADLVDGRPTAADLAAAERATAAAQHDTHDFVWGMVSWLSPVETVQGITTALNDLAENALPPLARVEPSLQPAKLRVAHNTIALAPLAAAAPTLRATAVAMARSRAEIADLPSGWFGPVSSARTKVLDQLTSLTGSVDDASRFATIGPAMLGADGPRRYFVGIQNNAEARATGGLVAAYAIVTADNGTIKVVQRGNDSELLDAPGPTFDPGKEYTAEYGNFKPTQRWITSNVSPDFPRAADNWAHLWEAQSGQHIDGSFGIDPYGLASILAAVGPVSVSGYSGVFTGQNLASYIEQTEYVDYPGINNPLRKDFVSKVAGAVLHKMLSGSGDPQAIATALGRSAGEGHLSLWSVHHEEQAEIAGTPLAGILSDTSGPFAAVSLDNAFGGKLDVYLTRSLTYRAGTCVGSRRDATITVTLGDVAPPTGLPEYVRYGGVGALHVEDTPRDRLLVLIHATRGAALLQASLDGRPVQVSPGIERGHPVYSTEVELNPGVPRTLAIDVNEPTSPGRASTKIQPLARAQHTDLEVPICS